MPLTEPEQGIVSILPSGTHERRLATGALAQQASQVTGTVVMLGVVTAIARSKTLPEFGLYGLLISISTYLLIAQTSVEGSTVKALSEAKGQDDKDRTFSIALSLYTTLGLIGGFLIAGGGLALLGILHIPARLHSEAIGGVLSVGAVTALGWPLKVFQDVLRGTKRFVLSAGADIAGYLLFAAASASLLLLDAPLWTLIAVGAALPALTGLASLLIGSFGGGCRFRPGLITRSAVSEFASLSGYLFLLGIADLVIYSLDRVVLSAFRSPRSVGLYEGPLRAHNLVRQINGTLALIVLPAAAGFISTGDELRVKELLIRGTRYVAAAVVPVTVALMVFAKPILQVWLGPRYATAGLAMTILVSYWLFASSTSVASPMLIAAGYARLLTFYAGGMAALNLVLSLCLTPSLGINGVVLGTAIPYALLSPVVLVFALRAFPIRLSDFVRRVWLPVFSLAVPLAAGLIVLRIAAPPQTVVSVGAVLIGGMLVYGLCFYLIWFEPGEKMLIRGLLKRREPRNLQS